jgi:hypothetical protein
MATFYVLPPRVCLEEQLGSLLKRLLPGLPLPVDAWDVLSESFSNAAAWPSDTYLVTRDDIPFGEPTEQALQEYFGAEPGDRVIEVVTAGSKTWTVSGVSAPVLV